MAEEASGNPSEMLGYFDDAMGQVEAWEGEVPKLRSALEMLGSAMADVPDVVRVVPAALDESLESAVADQEHLEEFVRDVAYEFLRLNGYEREDEVDEVLEADGDAIDVGPADRHAYLAEEAEGDAEALLGLLGDAGLLEPEWGAGLGPDDPEWDEVLALLGDAGEKMDQPTYSYAFYEALGVEGTLALGGVLDDIALHYEGNGEAQTGAELADPLIEGFASYTHFADAETREGLLAFSDPGEGELDIERMRLAVLFSGDGHLYEPELLGEAAYTVTWSRIESGRPEADLSEAILFRTLAENPTAAWYFPTLGDGDGDWLLAHALGFGDDDVGGPFYTGAVETWIGTSDQADIAGLHELWAAMTWAHSRGMTLEEIAPEAFEVAAQGLTDEELENFREMLASTGIGLVPGVGEIQSGVEVATGYDYIADEEVNQWIALAGLVPFGDLVKVARKYWRMIRGLDKMPTHIPPPPHHVPSNPPIDSSRRDVFEQVSAVNPAGHLAGGPNCIYCTIALYRRLKYGQEIAAPSGYLKREDGTTWGPRDLERFFDSSFDQIAVTRDISQRLYPSEVRRAKSQVVDQILQRGHGAQGVVVVETTSGNSHAFNVVNHRGDVLFLDGQSGGPIVLDGEKPSISSMYVMHLE